MSENINEVVNEEVNEVEATEAIEVTETAEVESVEEVVEAEVSPMLDRDEADLALVRKREIYDKITTALLILLMCAPFAILLYIIIWFLNP